MKKKIFLIVVFMLIFAMALAISGCTNNEGKNMNNTYESVELRGTIQDKAVLNPVFDWQAATGATKYTVTVKDAEGTLVESGEVTAPHYELKSNLKYSKSYVVTADATGADAHYKSEFETIAGAGTVNLKNVGLTVCEPFQSHMVLQRGKQIVFNGTTAANVLVTLELYGARYYAVSDAAGAYSVTVPAMAANATPTDIEFRILKEKKLTLTDVLVGDVFLVSGQSNVQRTLQECSVAGQTPEWTQDVADATTHDVRYYYQAENAVNDPTDSTKNSFWASMAISGDSYKQYSAVAFMVGAMLGKELSADGVPVGILYAAKGDTNITSWKGDATSKHYNGMIYPLRNTEITGVVWYQGCNNSAKGVEYEGHLNTLMANWRALFRNQTLPFYVVQLPCYDGDSGNNYDFSYVRESQAKACAADENAYLIATCDGGDPADIHPKQKRYICERLAKSILSTVYGADYLPQGPTYKSHERQGSSVIITVDNGEGLTATAPIVGFMLAGEDGKYFDATATISEGKIVVTSDKVSAPAYIKYGFSKSPFLNIYNKDGFLMSPFRTDNLGHKIDLLDYREGAVYTSNPGGTAMETSIVDVNGEVALHVTKPAGSVDYGILELAKWGAVGYDEHMLKLRIKGSGSGAKLVFRLVEGSYETWATPELTDNFTDVREVQLPISYLTLSSEGNGIFDLQSIWRVELVIKGTSEAVSVDVLEAKFVDFERGAPQAFAIKEAKNDGHEVTVKYGFSDFATSYQILFSTERDNFVYPFLESTTTELKGVFDASLFAADTTYYVRVIAINDIGQMVATESGMAVLDLSANRVELASFNFDNDVAFTSYIKTKLGNYSPDGNPDDLYFVLSRSDKGMKVNIKKKSGWMDFFVKVDSGTSSGFSALKFYMDVTEYKGSSVRIQLQTNGGSTSYTCKLDYSTKKQGYYEIPFNRFESTTAGVYNGEDIIRVKFIFEDGVAGADDNLYINNIEFVK